VKSSQTRCREEAAPSRAAPWWRTVRRIALAAGLGFVGWMLWSTLRNPLLSFHSISPLGFGTSLATGLVANVFVSVLYADLIGKLAPNIPFRRRLASYYFSQPAKYVPGRVAALLVQSATLEAKGAMIVTLVTSIELMAITIWTCTVSAVVCMLWNPLPVLAALVAGLGTLVAAWLIRIDWRPIMRFGWRLAGRSFEDHLPEPPERTPFARAVALAAGAILLPAGSMFALVAFGFRYGLQESLALTSALLLSWVGGTIAFLFPAGIGIREILFLGLGHAMGIQPPLEEMALIALLSRLVQVLIDVLGAAGFGAAVFLRRRASAIG
jgi:hypothetical protein